MNQKRYISIDEYQNVVQELWLLNESILRYEIDSGVSMREPLSSRLAAADKCIIRSISQLLEKGISIEPIIESVTNGASYEK